jgi:hypothetical protein
MKMNILVPKIEVLHWKAPQTQIFSLLKNNSNNFHSISGNYGDHLPK